MEITSHSNAVYVVIHEHVQYIMREWGKYGNKKGVKKCATEKTGKTGSDTKKANFKTKYADKTEKAS